MEYQTFFKDLEFCLVHYGREQLANLYGVSTKTLGRYLHGKTKPQPRMITRFYQRLYHHIQKSKTSYMPDRPSLEQTILLELCLSPMSLQDLEKGHGARGKIICSELMRKGQVFLNQDAKITVKSGHPETPVSILRAMSSNISPKEERADFCELHTLRLNHAGKARLREMMRELGMRIANLRASDSFRGNDAVVISTMARTFTFLIEETGLS